MAVGATFVAAAVAVGQAAWACADIVLACYPKATMRDTGTLATGPTNEVGLVCWTLTVTVAVAASPSRAVAAAATFFAHAVAELFTWATNACVAGRGTCSVFVLAVFCDGAGAG